MGDERRYVYGGISDDSDDELEMRLIPDRDPAAEAFQSFVTGWLFGSLMRPDFPVTLELEPHVAGGRWLPSFEIRSAAHRVVVHVEQGIA